MRFTGILVGMLVFCFGICSGGIGLLSSLGEGPDPKTGKIVSCAGCAVRPETYLGAGLLAVVIGLVLIIVFALRRNP